VTAPEPPAGDKQGPIRVRLYGLFWVTRRGYVVQLVLGGFLLCVLFVLWLFLPPLPRPAQGPEDGTLLVLVRALLENLHWIVLALTLFYILEATVVLRHFARARAKRKAPYDTPP
jgi:hypothetical protein